MPGEVVAGLQGRLRVVELLVGQTAVVNVQMSPGGVAESVTVSAQAPLLETTTSMIGLILAGHTHGGQVCLPWVGALVTNCDLPRRQAKGLSGWQESALHVSAGLGTSPFTPIRLACRPEATVLTVVPG